MDRRAFLKTMGAAALCAGQARALWGKSRGRPLKNWVWISINTTRSDDDWKRALAQMRESNIRAILPEIYNGTDAYYPSRRLPVKIDLLSRILPLARAQGLEVHPWIWCMPCMTPEVMQKHPDWYNVNARGESALDKPAYQPHYKFLDPSRPEVREWIQGTVAELAAIAEISGVHLDYIRHPDAILPSGLWSRYNLVQDKVYPPYDYGYTEYARGQFKKKHGIDPLQIKDPEQNRQWVQFRCDTVTDLVNHYLVPAAHSRHKQITAAVFPGPTLARRMVRQDWGRWKLDAFLPMLYHTFYEAGPEWVRDQTREGVAATRKPVYSGLFVHALDGSAFSQTVQVALAGGASGISIFSADGMDDVKWSALRQLTATA